MNLVQTTYAFGIAPPDSLVETYALYLFMAPQIMIPLFVGIGFLVVYISKEIANSFGKTIPGYKIVINYVVIILLTIVSTFLSMNFNVGPMRILAVTLLGYLAYFSIKLSLKLVRTRGRGRGG